MFLNSNRTRAAGLAALALMTATPGLAADLAYPYPADEPAPTRIDREERIEEGLPPPRPVYGPPRFVAGPYEAPPPPVEECRTIVKRRIDFDGEPIERRVRICDEAPYARPAPRFRPSFYRPHPVPPVEVPDGDWDRPPRW